MGYKQSSTLHCAAPRTSDPFASFACARPWNGPRCHHVSIPGMLIGCAFPSCFHAPPPQTAASAREKRTSSGRTSSGRTSDNIGKHHGYKGNILFKSLPPSEQETTA